MNSFKQFMRTYYTGRALTNSSGAQLGSAFAVHYIYAVVMHKLVTKTDNEVARTTNRVLVTSFQTTCNSYRYTGFVSDYARLGEYREARFVQDLFKDSTEPAGDELYCAI